MVTNRFRAALGGALASLVLGAGCSLVTSLDGYTGGSADASAPSSEAAAPPAPPAPPGDGGAPDADAGGRFCDSQSPAPNMCEDFDGLSVDPAFTTQTMPGCSVTVVDAGARTAPGALAAKTTGTTNQYARLRLPVTAGATHIRYAYDFRVETPGGYAELGYIRMNTSVGTQAHYFRMKASPLSQVLGSEVIFPDGGLATQHEIPLPGNPPLTSWKRLQLDLDLAAHTMTWSLDGVAAAPVSLEPALFVPGSANVEVGISFADTSNMPWDVRIDDVTVDWN